VEKESCPVTAPVAMQNGVCLYMSTLQTSRYKHPTCGPRSASLYCSIFLKIQEEIGTRLEQQMRVTHIMTGVRTNTATDKEQGILLFKVNPVVANRLLRLPIRNGKSDRGLSNVAEHAGIWREGTFGHEVH